MSGSVLVAVAAAIGNLLQRWDNATIAGATVITTFSGPVSASLVRRPMLIISSVLYFLSGFVMFWSPYVYVLLMARLLDGFGIGLAVTLVPVYISETAPLEIRGLLNTLLQFTGCIGMFFSYCMVFGMPLMDSRSWRLMLGVLSIPSVVYSVLAVYFLPESPRWLVSKGWMEEAKQVLQRLRGREDVSVEMALLVEGLGGGGDTTIEEYMIELTDNQDHAEEEDKIKLYGAEEGQSWVAKPVRGHSTLGMVSRTGSMATQSMSFMDPLVTLFGSVHEKLPEMGSMPSMLFSTTGRMFIVAEPGNEQWDEESLQKDGRYENSDVSGAESDDNLQSTLLSCQATNAEKEVGPTSKGSFFQGNAGEAVSGMGIGGGWQLAYKWSGKKGEDGKKELKRIYLHQENAPGSHRGSVLALSGFDVPAEGEVVHASAIVSLFFV